MATPQPTSSYTSYAPSQSMYTSYNTGEEWSQPAYPVTSIPSSSNVAHPVSKAFMALNASRSGQIGSGPQPLRSSREVRIDEKISLYRILFSLDRKIPIWMKMLSGVFGIKTMDCDIEVLCIFQFSVC